MSRRAVITGAGAVTPLGDLAQTCAALAEGRSAVASVQSFDATPFAGSRAGEIHAFDARPWFRSPKALKLTDRRTRFAVVAAAQAVLDAALPETDRERLGVLVGTSGSDVQTEDVGRALGTGDANDIDWFASRVLRRLNPLWLLVNLANMASAHVAIQLDARGPNSTITTDWIAGLQAIEEAARWIEEGEADAVVAGGADTGVLPFAFASFEAGGLLAKGFVPAEGAAMFVVEERERAVARGARILAEIGHPGQEESFFRRQECLLHTETGAENPGSTGVAQTLLSVPERSAIDDHTYEPFLGHALAAATPIALAVHLKNGASSAIDASASAPSGLSTRLALQCAPQHSMRSLCATN